MNKLLRGLIIFVIIAMIGAAILQLFFPEYLGTRTNYGLSVGWQREIGFWNIALIIILTLVLKYDNYITTKIVGIGLGFAGVGFGTNHLLAYLSNKEKYMSLFGAIENYILVIILIIALIIEDRKVKKHNL